MTIAISFERVQNDTPFEADTIRGLVWRYEPDGAYINDIAEGSSISRVFSYLAQLNNITHVRLPNGELDAGDELSLGEVAEAAYLDL